MLRKGPGDEVPKVLVNKSFAPDGTPGPGTDSSPAQRAAQGGLLHVLLEAGETEDVVAGHLDWLEEDAHADGAVR